MQLSRLPVVLLVSLGLTSQVTACSGRQTKGGDEQEAGESSSTDSSCLSDTMGPCLDPIETETDTGPCLGAPLPDFGPCLEPIPPDLPDGTDETDGTDGTDGTDETDTGPCLAGLSERFEGHEPQTPEFAQKPVRSMRQRIVESGILPADIVARLGLDD
jgi:hypothetical protein